MKRTPSDTPFQCIVPYDGAWQGCWPVVDDDELEEHLAAAHRAAEAPAPIDQRPRLLRLLADELREFREPLAHEMADEMGKVLAEGRAEVDKCAWVCEHYASLGAAPLQPRPIPIADDGSAEAWVVRRPLGVVLAVMPWNFPLWQVFRLLAPALLLGNTILLKHAPNVTGCAMKIDQLLRHLHDDGLPAGFLRVLLLETDTDRFARVVGDPRVAAVTLTGSSTAGRAVGAIAGRALKKCVLELGGSDPMVVLADADLERAAESAVTGRLINAGQSCIATKRLIAVEPVYEEIAERVVALFATKKVGSPLEEDTDLGPLARADLREKLHDQVERAKAVGARILCGGTIPDGPGFFYPPTVVTDVGPDSPLATEEVFGPVLPIFRVASEDEALAMANATAFGLGAAVFTADPEKGERWARERLRAGSCFVNDFVRSDPRLPFGGTRDSGFGRELGEAGLDELANLKTIWRSR